MSNSINVLLFLVSSSTCPCYPAVCTKWMFIIGDQYWYTLQVVLWVTHTLVFISCHNTSPPLCLGACFDVFAGKTFKLAFSVRCNRPDWHIFKMASCCTLTRTPLQSWQCRSQLCKGADNDLICCSVNIYRYPSVCMWLGLSRRINCAFCFSHHCCCFTWKRCQYIEVTVFISGIMEELHSLDPRRQELLEARFMGGVSGNTGGSTGSTSGGTKVSQHLAWGLVYYMDGDFYCP